MNDYILMKIFKLKKKAEIEKMQKTIKDMKDTSDKDDMFWTMKTIKNKDKRKEFREEKEGEYDEEKKKWEFCVTLWPPYIWNFFGEEEEKLDHLINAEANPEICYKYEENNRVKRIFETCTDLGNHML